MAISAEHGGLETKLVPADGFRVYRAWRIISNDNKYTLASMNSKKWDSKRLEAKCNPSLIIGGDHPEGEPSPGASCTCGIYGRYLSDDLFDVGIHFNKEYLFVIGSVLLSGLVDHGERGARGQYGTVEAIAPFYSGNPMFYRTNVRCNDAIRATAERYQIPFFKNMEDLVAQYPEEDTSFLDAKRALAEAQRKAEEAAAAQTIQDMHNGMVLTPEVAARLRNWVPPPNSSNVIYYSTAGGQTWNYNPTANVANQIITYSVAEIAAMTASLNLPCSCPTCTGKP